MSWLVPQLRPTFRAALRDVRAKSSAARVAAAERLGDPEPERRAQAIEALGHLTADPHPDVRRAAVQALGSIGQGEALHTLIERLDDGHPAVREATVIAVAMLGGSKASKTLRAALNSPHPEVRFQAVQGCAELCPEESSEQMLALIQDGDAHVRASAAAALGMVRGENGTRALKALREALADTDEAVRQEAALSLAGLGDDAATPVLQQALQDPDGVLEALRALGQLRHRPSADCVAALAARVLQPNTVKVAAARTLALLDDPRGVTALREVLTGWRRDGRTYAVEVVAELGLTELAPELKRLAKSPRGVDLESLRLALARLAPESPVADAGLQILSRRQIRR